MPSESEPSINETDILYSVSSPQRWISEVKGIFGDAYYFIPLLLPVSIYVSKRSLALASALSILIGVLLTPSAPPLIRAIYAFVIALGIAGLVVSAVRRESRW